MGVVLRSTSRKADRVRRIRELGDEHELVGVRRSWRLRSFTRIRPMSRNSPSIGHRVGSTSDTAPLPLPLPRSARADAAQTGKHRGEEVTVLTGLGLTLY